MPRWRRSSGRRRKSCETAAKEMLRLSMEKRLRAAEVQHRIDIHDQIESIDNSDEVWRKAAGARRS